MLDPATPEYLRVMILQALEQAPEGYDLAVIHTLLARSRRDTRMLPVMSQLVSGGYCEKVAQLAASFPNAGAGPGRTARRGDPRPVRFRLTDAGRTLLAEARASSAPLPPLPGQAKVPVRPGAPQAAAASEPTAVDSEEGAEAAETADAGETDG